MIKAIIIDDEPKGRNILQQLLAVHAPDINIVATAGSADEGLKKIDAYKPAVVFLDVEMPGKSGFDFLREAGRIDFKIIFVTAYSHYSLKAIKFNAFDYLMKPVDLDELKHTLEKLRHSVKPSDEKLVKNLLEATIPGRGFDKVAISSVDSITLVNNDDILYFEARGGATLVHLKGNKNIAAGKTVKEFEDLLSDQSFVRIHHSWLINLQHVNKYIKGEGGSVLMSNGDELEVSRRKKAGFLEKMASHVRK